MKKRVVLVSIVAKDLRLAKLGKLGKLARRSSGSGSDDRSSSARDSLAIHPGAAVERIIFVALNPKRELACHG